MNSFQKDKNLCDFCYLIFSQSSNLVEYTKILKSNPDWLNDNYDNFISEDLFGCLIDICSVDERFVVVLESVVEATSEDNITDRIFTKLINFSDVLIRERLIISLSHKSLTEKQLLSLCDFEITFECFFELAILYCNDPKCSLFKFKNFMEKFSNSKFSYMVNELFFELSFEKNASEKKKKWILKQIAKFDLK